MKKQFTRRLITILTLSASSVYAGNVGVDLNIHVGDQPRQVIVREPAKQPPAQNFSIEEDVDFVYLGSLGFYVAVGLPYDLFYMKNNYYVLRDGIWYRANRSHGPWIYTNYRDVPPGLRKNKIERIRQHRDKEYGIYRRDREHYRGKHFHSGKGEWKEHRKEDKEQRKEEKLAEKEERKQHKDGKHHD